MTEGGNRLPPEPEFWASIDNAPADRYVGSTVIDWGRRQRGQGKRMGTMIRGAMSDAPVGRRSYPVVLASAPFTEGERGEASVMEMEQKARVRKLTHRPCHWTVSPGTDIGSLIGGSIDKATRSYHNRTARDKNPVPDLIAFAQSQLENQFATGGVVVVAFGALIALMRNLPFTVWHFIRRRVVIVVDVADHDDAFGWIVLWLWNHEYTKRSKMLTLSTRRGGWRNLGKSTISRVDAVGEDGDGREIAIVYSPAPGRHILWVRGNLVLIERNRRPVDKLSGDVAYHESLTITALNREIVMWLVEQARAMAHPPTDRSISIMRTDGYEWHCAVRRPPRSMDSVILEGAIGENIVADSKKFIASEKWYADHGVPYQRGYLFEGPPGNGKSSLALAMAGIFGRDIYLLRTSALNDDQFQRCVSRLPHGAILLIEDVDCMFDGQTNKDESYVTFSGFLNGIDGVYSSPGRILIMTTNHADKLDTAIKRPGRVDRIFHIGNATPDQGRRMFLRFFPEHAEAADRFAKAVDGHPDPLSMAQLQEHLMARLSDPDAAATISSGPSG